MFSLIQRGQIYTDSAGYPVKIIRSTDHSVFFKRMDGYPVDWPPESPDNQYHLNK